MKLIDIHNIKRSYGKVQALSDVTLQLDSGAIGLVGNNGAGKSTLMKILLGLLKPDSGSGTILDCDIRGSNRKLLGRVGYMPENSSTIPILTGVEFVTLSGDLYGMSHRQAQRRAHEVLYYVGLGELRYRRLEEYSTGNSQRLKLAAALIHDPELLLLDEPTSGLDPAGRNGFLDLLQDLIAETGKSVILSTHLLGDIERLCERVVFLHEGQVVYSGLREEFRKVVSNHYEVGWQGKGESFLESIKESGATILSQTQANRAIIETSSEWNTQQLFTIAKRCNVLISHIKPKEENLEQLFFNMTNQQATT